MQVVTVHLRHDCPFSGPILSSPGATGTHFCHRGETALLEVHAPDPETLQGILDSYRPLGGEVVLGAGTTDRSAMVAFPVCACCTRGKVIPAIESTDSFYLPPTGYRNGAEVYQFALRDASAGPEVLSNFDPEVEVLRVASSPVSVLGPNGDLLVPASSLFSGVTPRQVVALRTAAAQGYYRIPRSVDDSDLARSLGVSRTAFENLLRKAENRILLSALEYAPSSKAEE